MNNICEIEVNPASGDSDREPYVNRQMDGWHAPYHNTTDFRQPYKTVSNIRFIMVHGLNEGHTIP